MVVFALSLKAINFIFDLISKAELIAPILTAEIPVGPRNSIHGLSGSPS